ncbi:MAG: hypothetical protein IKQ76_04945 [Bacteroidales bacterium]|nr:hypothetical protein [Bacteroidales bacterium]
MARNGRLGPEVQMKFGVMVYSVDLFIFEKNITMRKIWLLLVFISLAIILLVSGCGVHPDIASDGIDSIWLKNFSDKDLSSKVIVDESEWSEVIREIHRGRQTISKCRPEATLVIEYKNGSKDEFILNSGSDQLSIGCDGAQYSSRRKHPVLEKYLDLSNAKYISWPAETTGPNIPVRYCDIDRQDEDESLIGYVFVDTSNWMLPIVLDGNSLYTPSLSDLREAERILQREYPTILKKKAYDENGHLVEEGGLKNYARQYVFMKGPKGGRYVYINFVYMGWADLEDKEPPLCDPEGPHAVPPPPPGSYMSREWLIVDDGGDTYWRVFLDLDKGKVERCGVNGHA